tara:strand:- start:165 stop:374 length:210 start_codon:yes stop_codon:yes gene_type:complete
VTGEKNINKENQSFLRPVGGNKPRGKNNRRCFKVNNDFFVVYSGLQLPVSLPAFLVGHFEKAASINITQ